jgi:hypothetical protein
MIRVIIIFILTITINSSLQSNEILLQKNDVVITSYDLEKYIKLYNDFYGEEIDSDAAIKKLYMTFKLVDNQSNINPNFLTKTKKIISRDIDGYKEIYSEYIMSYFLRFEILKNDFISFYIKDKHLKELDELLIENISLFDDNECNMLLKTIKFNELNDNQKKIILSNLFRKVILIDENIFVCLDDKNKEEINNLVNGIFKEKGYKEFLKYVYKNIK